MHLGRLFIIVGILFLIMGLFLTFGPKIPGLKNLGHLPGDLRIQKEGFSFYFPVVTCLVISLALTLIFQLIRFFKK